MDLTRRGRRLRSTEAVRNLVKETRIHVEDLIYPLFVVEGEKVKEQIPSMPGVYHLSVDNLLKELEELQGLGIKGILLFGATDRKDEYGTFAYDPDGVVQRALRESKKHFPGMVLAADVCLCGYTSHGHCGIVNNGIVENDKTVEVLTEVALSYALAGADIIAPSDMMDGRVGAIRQVLDDNGFADKIIMSYSAKYASSFYGPFRDACDSRPAFGDRKSYQMDYSNKNEAVLEVEQDIAEGADIVMVKPALAYLDIINEISGRFSVPVAAYNVSGEYSMIKAAAQNGWIDEKAAVLESVTAIKRAGAKIIITYFAKQIAQWTKEK